ncbi:MAG: ATP-binding cassette domain-containing protein, partial [Eubacteriales bacterium]|nr:ATP-binding cassette domain-containing protein [Eubacteriales bacterium]
LGFKPFFKKKEKHIVYENMEKMGILNLKKKCYRELSGGQQQRVLLARALCATTKIILLDEPIVGLDPIVTNEFYNLVSEINKNLGITIIMVSHDIDCAMKYSSHILHMQCKQIFFGKTDEYLKSLEGKKFVGGENK